MGAKTLALIYRLGLSFCFGHTNSALCVRTNSNCILNASICMVKCMNMNMNLKRMDVLAYVWFIHNERILLVSCTFEHNELNITHEPSKLVHCLTITTHCLVNTTTLSDVFAYFTGKKRRNNCNLCIIAFCDSSIESVLWVS